MQTATLPLDETDCFSPLFIDYISRKQELEPFYSQFPLQENFKNQADRRNFPPSNRKILADVLEKQYEGLPITKSVSANIDQLRGNKTFTITTGHQLNIFTGPLYFIYKIVTVINACKALKKQYPDYHFVPVYWMASEDHDFDEISHFHFEGKKYLWETDQKGAVGRFAPEGMEKILQQLPSGADFFREAYSMDSLADAARHYVNHLFGEEGIVVIDADDSDLKKLFAPVIEDDLFVHSAQKSCEKDTEEIKSLGYKTQVTAREINFFYLEENLRERIEKTEEGYQVVNTDICFSESEIKKLIEDQPEKFSPNVILRPLYQETILPNLAYIGGPSEAVYWLQLKSVFEHFNTPFPMLMPRNFALVIPRSEASKWAKTGLETSDLFLPNEDAFSKWVKTNSNGNISYSENLNQLNEIYDSMLTKAFEVDSTLSQHLEALKAAAGKKVSLAEKKLLRAEKRKHAEKKNQIDSVKTALFPNGTLQERRDNFLNFYLDDQAFIKHLIENFDAFNYQMYLLYE